MCYLLTVDPEHIFSVGWGRESPGGMLSGEIWRLRSLKSVEMQLKRSRMVEMFNFSTNKKTHS